MRASKQYCLSRGYRLKGGTSRVISYITTLLDCYKACHSHSGQQDCVVFKFRWTTGECEIYFTFDGVTRDKDGTFIAARISCFAENTDYEPCLKRNVVYKGKVLEHERYSYEYKYKAITKCLTRCREFGGRCQYLSMDVVDFECKLFGPGAVPRQDIFSFSAPFACMTGLRCPELVISPSPISVITCHKLSTFTSPTWFLDNVPAQDTSYSYSTFQSDETVSLRLLRGTSDQIMVNVSASHITGSDPVTVSSLIKVEFPHTGAACLGNNTCELGWLKDPQSSNCYRFFPAALSWTDARNSCVGQGALLAVIPSMGTNGFITKNVTRGLRAWIGLHNRNTSNSSWQWSVVDKPVSFKNWAAGEPNSYLWPFFSEECTEIEDASGKWNDETCVSLRSYVCQKTLGCDTAHLRGYHAPTNSSSSMVGVGTTVTVDTMCRVGYRPDNKTSQTTCQADGSWSTANVKCHEIFCNDPTNSQLHKGKLYIDPPSAPYAVGSKIRYQCDIGYMLRGNAVSDCRDVDHRIPFGVWDQPPICLKSPECEDGWVAHNNYCYRYVPELMNWHDADARCQTLGGAWSRLVAINSQSENMLLQQLTNSSSNDVWIGLHDVPSEGIWEWLDGSAVSYKNFNTGEPNNGLFIWDQEDCVEMDLSTGKWNDEECDYLREFICEKFVAN